MLPPAKSRKLSQRDMAYSGLANAEIIIRQTKIWLGRIEIEHEPKGVGIVHEQPYHRQRVMICALRSVTAIDQ